AFSLYARDAMLDRRFHDGRSRLRFDCARLAGFVDKSDFDHAYRTARSGPNPGSAAAGSAERTPIAARNVARQSMGAWACSQGWAKRSVPTFSSLRGSPMMARRVLLGYSGFA